MQNTLEHWLTVFMTATTIIPLSPAFAADFKQIQAEISPVTTPSSLVIAPHTSRIYIPPGEEWLAVGRWLRTELSNKGCPDIEVVAASEAVDSSGLALSRSSGATNDFGHGCSILLGNMGNNALIRLLYIRWRTLLDADCLADSAWAVQGVPNSWGPGSAAVILHAANPGGAKLAGARLMQGLVASAGDFQLPVGFEFHPAAAQEGRVRVVAQQIDDLEKHFTEWFDRHAPSFQGMYSRKNVNPWMTDTMRKVGDLGLWWGMTADPRCPQLAAKILAQVQAALPEFQGDAREMNDLDYSLEPMVRGINLLLDLPVISPAERRSLLGFLALMGEVGRPVQEAPMNPKRSRSTVLSRHPVAMSIGLYWLARVLEERASLTGQTQQLVNNIKTSSEQLLDAMSRSYGGTFDHTWMMDAVGMLQQYALQKPAPDFVSQGRLRLGADFAAMMLRPTGDLVVWGGETISPDERFWAWPVMGRAETMLGGGKYQWLHDLHLGPGSRQKTFIYVEPSGIHIYNPGHSPVEPRDPVGLCVMPTNPLIDEDIQDGVRRLWNGLSPRGASPARRFFKIAYRSDWSTNAQYFAINGVGGYDYGATAMAGFLSYDQYGTQWLCTLQPRLSERYQNTVFVHRRGLQQRAMPYEAALEALDESDHGGYLRLYVDDCNGANWWRHVFWIKEGYLLVWDEVEARETDDFFLACNWRSPIPRGSLDASARTLTVSDGQRVFRIVNLALDHQSPGRMVCAQEKPDVFPFRSEREITTLCEKTLVHLAKGQRYNFVNLLGATDDSKSAPPRLEDLGDRRVRVQFGNESRVFALADVSGEIAPSNLRLSAHALQAGPAGWSAYDVSRVKSSWLPWAGCLQANAPVHLEVQGSHATLKSNRWKLDSVHVLPADCVSLDDKAGRKFEMGDVRVTANPKAIPSQLIFPKAITSAAPTEVTKLPADARWQITSTLRDAVSPVNAIAVGAVRNETVIAVGLTDKTLQVMDLAGHTLWSLPMPFPVSALHWFEPGDGSEPFLAVGLASHGQGQYVQAYDAKGQLLWENNLGESPHGPNMNLPYSLAQIDGQTTGSPELVVGGYCRVIFFSPQGRRIGSQTTDIFSALKHLVIKSPAHPWLWTATYRSPVNVLTDTTPFIKIWNEDYPAESSWPYQLLDLGRPEEAVHRLIVAHGTYLSSAEFDAVKGTWVPGSEWRHHLGADVRALCIVPSQNGAASTVWAAGDFGFLDRYDVNGRRLDRVPCEDTIHCLISLPSDQLLAGTEEHGLLILDNHGNKTAQPQGETGCAATDIRPLPRETYLVIRRNGMIQLIAGKKSL